MRLLDVIQDGSPDFRQDLVRTLLAISWGVLLALSKSSSSSLLKFPASIGVRQR